MRNIKLKIRRTGFFTATIVIMIFLIEYHLFYLFSYPYWMDYLLYHARYATLAAVAIGICFVNLLTRRNTLKVYGQWMINYSLIVCFSFFVLLIYSRSIYPAQKIIDTLAIGGRYACVLIVIPIMLLLLRDGGPNRLLTYLNAIVFIWYLYTAVQSIVYAGTGSFLFSFRDYYLGDVNIRNSNIRVTQGTFGTIMFLYNASILFFGEKKKKLFNLLMVGLSLYHVVFIQQTRVMIIVSAICLAFIILFYGKNIRQQIFRALSVLIAGVVLATSPVVAEFLSTFTSTSIEYEGSSIAREYATTYFWKVFLENPLVGYAWPADTAYKHIAHGALGTAYTSDVGFLGLMAETGLFSIVFFIVPLCRMIYILRKTRGAQLDGMRMFLMVIVVYLLATSVTVIITDGARCIALPVLMALFEYYYSALLEGKNSEDIYY